jgi:hypothetical protein
MSRHKIENKIQLETINVNKTIANKRRENKSKEKNKLMGWYEFLHSQHVIRGRKRRKRKKRKKERKEKQFWAKPR